MPKQYEEIKKSYLEAGKSEEEAEKLAAMTYNKHHPDNPVGPHSDDKGEYYSGRLTFPELLEILNYDAELAPEVNPVGRSRRYDEGDHRRDSSGKFSPKGGGGNPKKIGMHRYSVHPSQSGTTYEVVDTLKGNHTVATFPTINEATAAAASRNARLHTQE